MMMLNIAKCMGLAVLSFKYKTDVLHNCTCFQLFLFASLSITGVYIACLNPVMLHRCNSIETKWKEGNVYLFHFDYV